MIPGAAPTPATTAGTVPTRPRGDLDDRIRRTAEDFETAFLSEMLTAAGLGKAAAGFGGGIGEAQFASFLVREQARNITHAGGLGLSEVVYQSIRERQHG